MELGKFKPSTHNLLKDSLGTLNIFGYGKIDHLPKHIPTGSRISVAFPSDPNTGTTLLGPGHPPRWSNDQDLLVRLDLLADDAATWGRTLHQKGMGWDSLGCSPMFLGEKWKRGNLLAAIALQFFPVCCFGGSCLKCIRWTCATSSRLDCPSTMQSRKINEQIMWQTKHQF